MLNNTYVKFKQSWNVILLNKMLTLARTLSVTKISTISAMGFVKLSMSDLNVKQTSCLGIGFIPIFVPVLKSDLRMNSPWS